MKNQLKHLIYRKEFSRLKYITPVIIIVVFLAGILGTLIYNTTNFHSTLQENTKNYANDETSHMALNISSRMKMRQRYIQNLADTFSRIPKSLLTPELLKRKADYLDMTSIFVVAPDGSTIPEDQELGSLKNYLHNHPNLYFQPKIFVTNKEDVFFSAPIKHKNGDTSILVGSRTKTKLQEMLQNVTFKDQVRCSIADSSGSIIIPATDDSSFQDLNNIFSGNAKGRDAEEAQKMLSDIGLQNSGAAQFDNITKEKIILGYDFLGINDWILLTIVPSTLFSDSTAPYFNRYTAIICFISLVVLLLFLFVPWYYQRALQHIKSVAFTDPLTGGYNDLAFRTEAEELLAKDVDSKYVVIYLNIHNFKLFNERFGVKSGDELLCQICRILKNELLGNELLSRYSGDHFFLLLNFSDEGKIIQRLQTMLHNIEEQLSSQFSFDNIGFDQGACVIADRSTDFRIITDHAKVASSYQTDNDVCRFYDDDLEKHLEREHTLDANFQQALINHEFQLYIQPKVCPKTNTIEEGEVLVRWQHPEFGLLQPGEFIPLFEHNGKICDLDFYMFEETCKLMNKWQKKGKRMILSVNLSRAHLLASNLSFIDRLKEIKESYHIPDHQIELELTESMLLSRQDVHLVKAMINRIREAGFLCSIDDFGFGYSSLTILKDLNVNTVKLDRQFFIDESEKSWMVVEHLIQLIHKLEMTVVGEGIESITQVQKLQTAGCNLIQGYFYAKPMPVCDFENWSAK